MQSDIKKILKVNLMSDISLTHLKTFEYSKMFKYCEELSKELGYRSVLLWKKGEGFLDTSKDYEKHSTIEDYADDSREFDSKTMLIFQDIHRIYDDPKLLIYFQKLLQSSTAGDFPINCIGLSPTSNIPMEIERFAQLETIALPTQEEIYKQTKEHFESYGVYINRSMLKKISETLLGLIEDEIPVLLNKILVKCFSDDTLIDQNILSIAQEQKKQIIKKSGILEFVDHSVGIEDVGGLFNLKRWLKERKEIFDDTQRAFTMGVKPPKGILLFGMPGSGKSLVSKVTAKYFGMPLLRVDMGLVYGQKSPEEAIGRMIALADAIAPCVLWIDEIEKALSGAESGSSNDVAVKILGILLTWMQERTKPVFIVATANDISMIRPELYRDGRIDEKFMLGFLGEDVEQIEQIIQIHLKTRLKDNIDDIVRPLDYRAIAKKMMQMVAKYGDREAAGYTGANMEALVEKVLIDRFTSGKEFIETRDFVRILNQVNPQHGIEIKKMNKRAQEMEAIGA